MNSKPWENGILAFRVWELYIWLNIDWEIVFPCGWGGAFCWCWGSTIVYACCWKGWRKESGWGCRSFCRWGFPRNPAGGLYWPSPADELVIIPEDIEGVQTNEDETLQLRGIGGEEGLTIEMLPFKLISMIRKTQIKKMEQFCGIKFNW